MKTQSKMCSKFATSIALAIATLSFCPVQASDHSLASVLDQVMHLNERVSLLESAFIPCGPLKLSEVHLGNQKTFLNVLPGQKVESSIHYELDASQQHFLDKHYLVVGIEGVAAETCITHLYGVWDSESTKKFNLTAPLQEGEYEVKVAYYPADSAEDALAQWNVLQLVPANSTTIGIIRVRNAL